MKPMRLTLFAALAVLIGAGCDKSATPASRPTVPYSLTSQTVARFHWRGKRNLAANTNAAALMRLWDEPESAVVETQVLDKLSTAPRRLLPHVATTNFTAAAPLLRSLLDDCVQQESYLEVRAATNQPGELAFAVHLPVDRAIVWQTNLAAVLESLTGLHPEPAEKGWSLKKHETPNHIELTRVGEWVVVGVGQGQNALFGDFVARILRNHTPLIQASADFWLDAELDLRRVTEAFKLDWHLPDGLPIFSMQTVGDGQFVRTRGKLDFPAPLKLDLEPWQIPLSLVHPPISSFTAIRGFKPWLASLKAWNDLQIGGPPNQFFGWALNGAPQMTFFAVPFQDASNRVAQASDLVMEKYGHWFATNDSLSFERAQDSNGLVWKGVPFLTPYLQSIKSTKTNEGEYAFVGLFPPRPPTRFPLPPEMLQEIAGRTNLVYYDWELTGPRIESLLYVGQFFRMVSHKAQLPSTASLAWLNVATTNLGNCVTEIVQTGPEQLSFVRTSSCGFSAIELHLVADWLESPQFPQGFYTLLAPPPTKMKPRPKIANPAERRENP